MSFIQYMVPCDIEEGTYGQPEANATAMKSLPSVRRGRVQSIGSLANLLDTEP